MSITMTCLEEWSDTPTLLSSSLLFNCTGGEGGGILLRLPFVCTGQPLFCFEVQTISIVFLPLLFKRLGNSLLAGQPHRVERF